MDIAYFGTRPHTYNTELVSSNQVRLKKLHEDAIVPTKSNPSDAGFDLYSIQEFTIMPTARQVIKTGIAMAIPNGHVGLVWPRSGLAVKNGVDTLAGVIDAGYRGEICVVLQNHSNKMVQIRKGDRIAQLLIQEITPVTLVETESLDDADRGEAGFGSTGA